MRLRLNSGLNAFYLFLLLFSVLCVSCSDSDDEKFVIPVTPGVNLQDHEVQLVFHATAEECEVSFTVESKSSEIAINWGESSKLYSVTSGEVSYVYPPEEKTYVITVISSGLSKVDMTHEKSKNIIGLYAGECPEFMDLSFSRENKLEAFDLRKCPQFNSILMQVNTENFDLNGFSNAEELYLYMSANAEIDLKGYDDLQELSVYLDKGYSNSYKAIRVTDSPELRKLKIEKYFSSGVQHSPYTVFLEDLIIEAPQLNLLQLSYLHLGKGLNLQKAGSDWVDVVLYGCDSYEKLVLSPATRQLDINNMWKPVVDFHIEELDLSACRRLEWLKLDHLSSLKKIVWGDPSPMQWFWMQQCPFISEIDFTSYSFLEKINCFGNERLERVKLAELPQLAHLCLMNNEVLTGLTAEQLPVLSDVDIRSNKLDEQAIATFVKALPDALSPEGKLRSIKLEGNPGDTEYVHSIVGGKQNWQLVEYGTEGGTRSGEAFSSEQKNLGDVIHLKGR